MKKAVLFLAAVFMMVSSVEAINGTNLKNTKITKRYFNETVSFIERGVEFHVFLNGDFDFDTHFNEPRYVDYYGRRAQTNRGVRIERDYNGKVRRVGNVFINYDFRGNVTRIGSVYLGYRRGYLTRVGGLRIDYDRWGDPHFYGRVKFNDSFYYNDDFNLNINIGPIYDYNDNFFYRDNFRNNYRRFREDNNFYYYRANPRAKVGKKAQVIKRRKPSKKAVKRFDKHENKRRVSIEPEQKTPTRRRR